MVTRTSGSDLFDRRPAESPLGQAMNRFGLRRLLGIGLTFDAVHGNSNGLCAAALINQSSSPR